MIERDLRLSDGRTLHVYDASPGESGRLPVVWHHGTPNVGAARCPTAALRLSPGESHFTIVTHAELGLQWLREQV